MSHQSNALITRWMRTSASDRNVATSLRQFSNFSVTILSNVGQWILDICFGVFLKPDLWKRTKTFIDTVTLSIRFFFFSPPSLLCFYVLTIVHLCKLDMNWKVNNHRNTTADCSHRSISWWASCLEEPVFSHWLLPSNFIVQEIVQWQCFSSSSNEEEFSVLIVHKLHNI